MQRKIISTALILATALLLAAGCGDDDKSFTKHTFYAKIAGYYVLTSTPEAERAMLRVGVFGLNENKTAWLEVMSAPVTKHPNTETVDVAKLELKRKPDGDVTMQESTYGKSYYLLQLRAFLDQNANQIYDVGEPWVDGFAANDYDTSASQLRLYFFAETAKSEHAEYGWNYQPVGASDYRHDFETLDPTSTGPQFFIQTRQLQ